MNGKLYLEENKMKGVKSVLSGLALVMFLVPVCSIAQIKDPVPFPNTTGVPVIIDANQTEGQKESHFLTFLGSFIQETPASAKAYYTAIDPPAPGFPNGHKDTFTRWLVNAGFIKTEAQWNSSGPQTIDNTCTTNCAKSTINADSHVLVLNAADLGFVRNQYIRCVPSCTAQNPIIYTYLENYPVAPFTGGAGSGFPIKTGFPSQAEADAAIKSSINRPDSGPKARIADVAFEWAPSATSPTSSTRFGQLYAYIVGQDSSGNTTETISFNNSGSITSTNGSTFSLGTTDPFPPQLDGLGFKEHPGVCLICHGGAPTNLVNVGGKMVYPRNGNINGFRLLPVDVGNLMFASPGDPSTAAFTQANQEASMKEYNKVVLVTVPSSKETDDQGVSRVPHLREVILGWYAGFPGDQNMTANVQDDTFTPVGWREAVHGGTAPKGSEQLYHDVVSKSCRSCHFNRELSLDFGTVGAFDQESDLLQLALLPECPSLSPNYSVDPKLRPMPLAVLTFQRLWEAQAKALNSPGTIDQLKAHFGFHTPGAYCATNP
jgi:hypothetical protein